MGQIGAGRPTSQHFSKKKGEPKQPFLICLTTRTGPRVGCSWSVSASDAEDESVTPQRMHEMEEKLVTELKARAVLQQESPSSGLQRAHQSARRTTRTTMGSSATRWTAPPKASTSVFGRNEHNEPHFMYIKQNPGDEDDEPHEFAAWVAAKR